MSGNGLSATETPEIRASRFFSIIRALRKTSVQPESSSRLFAHGGHRSRFRFDTSIDLQRLRAADCALDILSFASSS